MVDINELDFAKKPSKAKEKAASGGRSSIDLRYRKLQSKGKIEGKFIIGDKAWKENSLDTFGIAIIVGGRIAIVDNENATSVKRTLKLKEEAAKGRNFKSEVLEDALATLGILDKDSEKSQPFTLSVIAENIDVKGVKIHRLLSVTPATKEQIEAEAKEQEEVTETTGITNSEPVMGSTIDSPEPKVEAQNVGFGNLTDIDDNF